MVSLARRKKKEKQILYSKDIDFFWSEINSPFIVFPFPFPFPFPFSHSLFHFQENVQSYMMMMKKGEGVSGDGLSSNMSCILYSIQLLETY